MRISRMLAAISSLLLVAGCASKEKSYVYIPPENLTVATSRPVSDVALETQLRNELNRYGDLAAVAPNVQIAAQSGIVTLSGIVPTEKYRQMIEALVRNTGGVASINNQILVSYPPTGSAPATPRVYPVPSAPVVVNPEALGYPGMKVEASTEADQVLAGRILDRLRSDKVAPSAVQGVILTVTGREVFIHGFVNSKKERKQIISSAEHTPDVGKVHEHLHLR